MTELLLNDRDGITTSSNPEFAALVSRNTDNSIHPHDLYMARVAECVGRYARVEWLDVGCGWHCDWPWALEREQALLGGTNICGIDPDWQAIVRHRTIRRRVVGVVEALPYGADTFDLVTANVVVEHLEHPEIAFAEIFRVLRPGGVFVFRTPSARSYFVRVAQLLPEGLKRWLASQVIERRNLEDIYPALYRANTSEAIENICKSIGFRSVNIVITKTRGILGRFPRLNQIERFMATRYSNGEGTLLVEAYK